MKQSFRVRRGRLQSPAIQFRCWQRKWSACRFGFLQPGFASYGAGLNSDRVGFPIAIEIRPGGIPLVTVPNRIRILRLDDRDMVGANQRANAVIGFSDLISLNLIDKPEDILAGGSGLAHDVLYISSQFS